MVYVVFLILTIPMSIAVVCYKLWRMRSRTGRFREKKVEVFSGDEEGVLQRVEKKEGVTGPFRREELRCSRTCQEPGCPLRSKTDLL